MPGADGASSSSAHPHSPPIPDAEKQRIRDILSTCYSDGIMPRRLSPNTSPNTVEVGEDYVRVTINPEVLRIQADWLKEHVVTILYGDETTSLPVEVKKRLVRIYEDGWATSRAINAPPKRGLFHNECKNLVTYVSASAQVATFMLRKGHEKVTLDRKVYSLTFQPWMNDFQLQEWRETMRFNYFWIKCLQVPVSAMPQLENVVEEAFGQILKSYPAFKEPNSPELLNIRFDLVSSARLRFKPWLCLDLAEHGYVELEVIGADTPWCASCKQFYHFAGDPSCPKNKNRNSKGQEGQSGQDEGSGGGRDKEKGEEREKDPEKGPEKEHESEGGDGKSEGNQGDEGTRLGKSKGEDRNTESNVKGKGKDTRGRNRRVLGRKQQKKVYRQVRKAAAKGKEESHKDTEMEEATEGGEKEGEKQPIDVSEQEEGNGGQGGGQGEETVEEKGKDKKESPALPTAEKEETPALPLRRTGSILEEGEDQPHPHPPSSTLSPASKPEEIQEVGKDIRSEAEGMHTGIENERDQHPTPKGSRRDFTETKGGGGMINLIHESMMTKDKFAEEEGLGASEGSEETNSSEDIDPSENSKSPRERWDEDEEEVGTGGEEEGKQANGEDWKSDADSEEEAEEDFLGVVGNSLSGEGNGEGEEEEDEEVRDDGFSD
ncbi:hypothetical protein CBR_g42166 [Chara braunii]|uniref:Uncharacterized protein n=1 Tax=Chara braunii TaxID=69332 RepID=A0A388LXC5_CHABU|nr:hypothetical protein CBR_g42166 [Chara braunii]|eukprot:GBG86882.1 hypothetical protein CBR_g42166 [Chara braunii]